MDLERAAMKAKLADAKSRKAQLEVHIRAGADNIRTKLNHNLVGELTELEVNDAGILMEQLQGNYIELLAAVSEISRLEKVLA